MREKQDKFFFFVCGVILTAFVIGAFWISHTRHIKQKYSEKLIEYNIAEYQINPKTGETSFVWLLEEPLEKD